MDCCSNSCSSSSSLRGSSSMVAPMNPKSPPGGLDLNGKKRQMVKLQILEKEIDSLQEELECMVSFQPASRCCKELNDFIGAKPDPLVKINEKNHESHLQWKRLCGWEPHLEMPNCSDSDFHRYSCLEKMKCQSGRKCFRLHSCIC